MLEILGRRSAATVSGRMQSFFSLRAVALAAIAVLGAAGAVRADLLVNGSLDLDADASGAPDGWSNWTYGPTAFAAWKNDPSNDPFDFNATPYVNAGNFGEWWSSGGGWFEVVPGVAGQAYTFSAFSATEGWDNMAGEIRTMYVDELGNELQRDVRLTANYEPGKPWAPYAMTTVAPAGTAFVKVEFGTFGARGALLWDDAALNAASIWNVDAAGSAAAGSNWLGGTAPDGVDAAASFHGAISAPRTVAVDAPLTLGTISFANANSYVIAGTSTLRLETSSGYALVDVQGGTHRLNLPMTVASDTYFAVASGATLEIGDALTVAAGKTLRSAGGGAVVFQSSVSLESAAKLVLTGDNTLTALNLAANANVTLPNQGAAKTLTANALSSDASASIDLQANTLVLNYSGASPVGTIRDLIGSAYNNGAWTGPGITSLGMPAGRGLGYIDSGSSITVRMTRVGDATLNDAVDFDDLLLLAQNYGTTAGATWSKGDFNYNGGVEFDDLLALAQNYGASGLSSSQLSGLPADFVVDWNLALSMVPEPASFATIVLLGTIARRRR